MRPLTRAIADAHINREMFGDPRVTINELDTLIEQVDRLNTTGSSDAFIDAQAALIDALLVRHEQFLARPGARQ